MTPSPAIKALNGRPGIVRNVDGVVLVEPLYVVPGPWSSQGIIDRVCEAFDVPRWLIMGDSRTARTATARQAIYYLLRHRRGLSSPQIGNLVGRDHKTVLFGIDAIKQRMANDPALRAKVEGCA